ncbi:4900_t:CDS:10, partial [Racocetra fulgida]
IGFQPEDVEAVEYYKKRREFYEAKSYSIEKFRTGLTREEYPLAIYAKKKDYDSSSIDIEALRKEITFQEYLNQKYPNQEDKEKLKTRISNKLNGGELNLSSELKSPLIKLNITGCTKLKKLCCRENLIVELDLSKNEKLKILGDHYCDEERISQGIFNRFTGSLGPLKNLGKLENLDIINTDIDGGLEYLPVSLKWVGCRGKRPGAKANELYDKELHENYPEGERAEKLFLSIYGEKLKGGLRLKGFTKLETFGCWDNQLTNIDLSDCRNLKHLSCENNELINLDFLETVTKLEKLNMKDNKKLSGQTLKSLTSLKELRRLDISNCPLEGSLKPLENSKLEELNITNTNLTEGLEYLPEKDKQNKMLSDVIPLERLFVIRGNLKSFVNRWGIKEGQKVSELMARATAVTGGVLAATVNPILGGILAAASPVVEVNSFHELLGILAPIEIKELLEGKVSQAVEKLNTITEEFLAAFDKDKNKEISIVEAIKDLETEIIYYRKLAYGTGEETDKEKEIDKTAEQLELEEKILKLQNEIKDKEKKIVESYKNQDDEVINETPVQKLQNEIDDLKIILALKEAQTKLSDEEPIKLEQQVKDLEVKLKKTETKEGGQSSSEGFELLDKKVESLKNELNEIEQKKKEIEKQLNQTRADLKNLNHCCQKETKKNKGKAKEIVSEPINNIQENQVNDYALGQSFNKKTEFGTELFRSLKDHLLALQDALKSQGHYDRIFTTPDAFAGRQGITQEQRDELIKTQGTIKEQEQFTWEEIQEMLKEGEDTENDNDNLLKEFEFRILTGKLSISRGTVKVDYIDDSAFFHPSQNQVEFINCIGSEDEDEMEILPLEL